MHVQIVRWERSGRDEGKCRHPVRAGLALILAIIFAAGLSGCYLSDQASRFLALQARARPAASLLADPKTPAPERDLLERVAKIRAFAVENIGLRNTKSFRSLVEIDGDRVATVVQACAALSFDRYLWSYPVVGKLPYKGFYDPKDAEKERDRLKAQGYDVIVRGVDSFSTLGWFADPLYSFMESYKDAELAELVIHEMTHATAFSRSPGDFNEELATFVGRSGADEYLAATRGPDSPDLAEARRGRGDEEAFASFLRGTAAELEKLYEEKIPDADKRAKKAEIIAARAALYRKDYAPRFGSEAYRNFPMDRMNNAYLDLYKLYEGEPALYADYERAICGGDLRRFVREAVRLAAARGDPKAVMRAELAAAGVPGYATQPSP